MNTSMYKHQSRGSRLTLLEPLEARLALSGFETVLLADMPEPAMMFAGAETDITGSIRATPIAAAPRAGGGGGSGGGGGGNKPPATLGNNLSFPVVWAEGADTAKALRGTFGAPDLDLQDRWAEYTLSGVDYVEYLGATGAVPAGATDVTYIFQQQGPSTWQAETIVPTDDVVVQMVDWGDNLESVDWYTRSKVRTEVVLTNNFPLTQPPLVAYQMEHLTGLGINELWGVATQNDKPQQVAYGGEVVPQATVYSHDARMTIQKLNVPRGDPQLDSLVWNADAGHWEGGTLINEPIFNSVVREAADGPAYFSAEVNVKGKVIYGYTWDVRKLSEGPSDYRLTFSLDGNYSDLNTFFVEGVTEIVQPEEDEEIVPLAPAAGGTAELDFANQLSFIDVRILARGGGGGAKAGVPVARMTLDPAAVGAALQVREMEREQTRVAERDGGVECVAEQARITARARLHQHVATAALLPNELPLQVQDRDQVRDCIDAEFAEIAEAPDGEAVEMLLLEGELFGPAA